MATGHPNSSPKATTSSADRSTSVVPGTPTTPARWAASRELILSPMTSMASGGGPIQVTPAPEMARAKSAFSEKKPYPGWTPSAPERPTTSRILSVLRYDSAAVCPPRAYASSASRTCSASRSSSE